VAEGLHKIKPITSWHITARTDRRILDAPRASP
jgi:hypothetical protein